MFQEAGAGTETVASVIQENKVFWIVAGATYNKMNYIIVNKYRETSAMF